MRLTKIFFTVVSAAFIISALPLEAPNEGEDLLIPYVAYSAAKFKKKKRR